MYTNEKKQELQKKVDAGFVKLSALLSEEVAAKTEYKKQLQLLESQRDIFSASEIENRNNKLAGEAVINGKPLHQQLQKTLHDLDADLSALHGDIDLNDPRLVNALAVIEKGGDISAETAKKLNEPFARNQGALSVLHGAYLRHGHNQAAALTGGMVYDFPAAMKRVLSIVDSFGSSPDTEINLLSSEIGLIARMEGQSFDSVPDKDGMNFSDALRDRLANPSDRGTMEAVRQGAGLK